MTARKTKRYDYVDACEQGVLDDPKDARRILRRLVREAVTLSYGPRPEGDPQFLKSAVEGVKIEADRIAKELVP